MSPDELRQNIRKIKEETDKPFGVNFMPDNPRIEELLDVIIEEKVPMASYGKGNPKKIIERTKPHGIINMPTMGSLKHALRAEKDGADAVIVQGAVKYNQPGQAEMPRIRLESCAAHLSPRVSNHS
jgi:enoyl-[acyl-carrier protein] reductase II